MNSTALSIKQHTGLTQRYCLDSTAILDRQAEQESNARSYPRRIPLVLQRGYGVYLQDSKGQVFIDCLAGAGTLALGHNHPVVVEAIQQALNDGLPLHTLDLSTAIKDAFVQELFDCLPAGLASKVRIQFCGPSGADAVEAALKLTRTATHRHGFLAFQGSYHGMTLGALSVSGGRDTKAPLQSLLPGVQFLPYPYAYRCPFGNDSTTSVRQGLRYIESLLNDQEGGIAMPAAMILEVVQGEGGVIPAPVEWLKGIRRVTEQHAIPLIIDEIQTGIGRTGRMFAFEHADILPDVITLSKAIGGGLPLAVTLYKKELDQWQPGAHAGTFRGNQLAMAAGLATLRFIKAEQLVQRAEEKGQLLHHHLLGLQRDFSWIGDVRGLGLMLGMEIVDPHGPTDDLGRPKVDPVRARRFQRACLERGLILELGGRHGATARLLPPLIISDEEIHLVAEILLQAAEAVHTDL